MKDGMKDSYGPAQRRILCAAMLYAKSLAGNLEQIEQIESSR